MVMYFLHFSQIIFDILFLCAVFPEHLFFSYRWSSLATETSWMDSRKILIISSLTCFGKVSTLMFLSSMQIIFVTWLWSLEIAYQCLFLPLITLWVGTIMRLSRLEHKFSGAPERWVEANPFDIEKRSSFQYEVVNKFVFIM